MNDMDLLVAEIRAIMETARANVSREINTTMLITYWQVGRTIVEREQNGNLKAQYGKKLLPELSKRLTKELGKGYSRSNLQNMRLLYHEFPEICQTPSGKLTWSHYIELLAVSDKDARDFYQQECVNSKWSVKELNRQIGTSLFERLLLSSGKANKEKVLALANEGVSMSHPEDMLKQPYVFEFLGVPENKPTTDVTGKYFTILQKFSLRRRGRFTKQNHLTLILMLVSMLWIRRPLTFACHCFRGRTFAKRNLQSRCTRSSTCKARYPISSLFLRGKRMMSK